MRVLYICTGNGYRSPIAEALTREYTDFEVESAGIDPVKQIPLETGKLLEGDVENFLKPSPDKVSQRALSEADKIICMTDLHSEYVKRNFELDPGKIEVWHVKDPAHPSKDLENTLKSVERKVRGLKE